jgi:small subunit ribosomal protein S1
MAMICELFIVPTASAREVLDDPANGLLHASQVSWLNKRPKIDEVLRIGDELDVVVLEVEQSKQSGTYYISLGHRQTEKNPWEGIAEKHPVGSRVKAKVVKLFDGGAFVELDGGFRALVPHSEVSWTETIKPKAHDFLRVGQEIEVIVQLVDK